MIGAAIRALMGKAGSGGGELVWEPDFSLFSYDSVMFDAGVSINDGYISPDGSFLYVIKNSNPDYIERYLLSVKSDLSTASSLDSLALGSGDWQGITIDSAGVNLYCCTSLGEIKRFSLSEPWRLSGAVAGEIISYEHHALNDTEALAISSDGNTLFVANEQSDQVAEIDLVNAPLLTGATNTRLISVAGQHEAPRGLFLSPDGTQLVTANNNDDKIYVYNLDPANSLSGAVYSGTSKSVYSQADYPRGVSFTGDGKKMFIFQSDGEVYRYTTG